MAFVFSLCVRLSSLFAFVCLSICTLSPLVDLLYYRSSSAHTSTVDRPGFSIIVAFPCFRVRKCSVCEPLPFDICLLLFTSSSSVHVPQPSSSCTMIQKRLGFLFHVIATSSASRLNLDIIPHFTRSSIHRWCGWHAGTSCGSILTAIGETTTARWSLAIRRLRYSRRRLTRDICRGWTRFGSLLR